MALSGHEDLESSNKENKSKFYTMELQYFETKLETKSVVYL